MIEVEIDASEFRRYQAELVGAAKKVDPAVKSVVGRGALNVKRDWNAAFAGSKHFKGLAGSVSYDTRSGVGWVEALVGPDKSRRGGALANIAHFGGAHGGGGTVADPQAFLDDEAPRFLKALADALAEAMP